MDKIPQLRLLITGRCKYSCDWCHLGGEGGASIGYSKPNFELDKEEIIMLLTPIIKCGITHIKISGGEPLLRKDLLSIIKEIKSFNNIKIVELVTMSPKLREFSQPLSQSGLDCLTVSLDTLNRQKFQTLTGSKNVMDLDLLLEGITKCSSNGMHVKINFIPQKGFNDDEIIKIAKFAGDNDLSLKIIDLMSMNPSWWGSSFMPISKVEKILHPMIVHTENFSFQPGLLGTPMKTYILKNGVTVNIRDAKNGTHYGEICKNCLNYPCQDGLMALRLTCDGKLKFCLYRNDNLIDLFSLVKQSLDVEKTIHEVINIFKNSELKRAWSPEIELQRINQMVV